MKEFTLTLNENEVNMIMGVLGKQPYESVFSLVQKIQQQAQTQMQAKEEEAE